MLSTFHDRAVAFVRSFGSGVFTDPPNSRTAEQHAPFGRGTEPNTEPNTEHRTERGSEGVA